MPSTSPSIPITSRILPCLSPHNTHSILHSTLIELFVDASFPWSIAKDRDDNSIGIIFYNYGAVCKIHSETKIPILLDCRFFAGALGALSFDGAADKLWPMMVFHGCRRYNSQWWSWMGYWAVDTGVSREMGRLYTSSTPCQLAAG